MIKSFTDLYKKSFQIKKNQKRQLEANTISIINHSICGNKSNSYNKLKNLLKKKNIILNNVILRELRKRNLLKKIYDSYSNTKTST